MNLSELFKRLSYGELSNLAISDEGSGTLNAEQYPKIIQYTNEALIRLFSRFRLREKDILIEQVAHITNYHLRREYAETANDTLVRHPYIKDLPGEPFLEDVIRILEVHSELGELPLNDKGDPNSLFTPQPDILQVPNPMDGRPLSVLYQARHPVLRDFKLRKDASYEDDVLSQIINIPFFLEGALQCLIASYAFSHMNGQDNISKSQEMLMLAEKICLEIEEKDLVNQTAHTSHNKFEHRGFV